MSEAVVRPADRARRRANDFNASLEGTASGELEANGGGGTSLGHYQSLGERQSGHRAGESEGVQPLQSCPFWQRRGLEDYPQEQTRAAAPEAASLRFGNSPERAA